MCRVVLLLLILLIQFSQMCVTAYAVRAGTFVKCTASLLPIYYGLQACSVCPCLVEQRHCQRCYFVTVIIHFVCLSPISVC